MPADDTDQQRRALLVVLERLHRHKDAAYGDAWRRRGEVIAIFANMARKYDRLVVAFEEAAPAAAEPLGDTAADLCVYTAKYLTWIADEHPDGFAQAELGLDSEEVSDARGPSAVATVFDKLADEPSAPPPDAWGGWQQVQVSFSELEQALMAQATPDAPRNRLLDYPTKTRLAWRLLAEVSWLLVRIENEQPDTIDRLRAEVETMDRAAGR
jgi:hypothetical protein